MDLDLSFLDFEFRSPSARPQPVNVYEILRDGWRETRVDMTLQFFLDPGERHGLGTLVIDALLSCLDGASTIGPDGRASTTFTAKHFQGSEGWEVAMQVNFIDVLATNPELGVAIVLENKIGHDLNNPLGKYARHALSLQDIQTVVVAVLAPTSRSARQEQAPWLSRSVTYEELTQAITRAPGLVGHLLNPADQDQRRSLELLQQFIEARTGDVDVDDLNSEQTRLTEWRQLVDRHREAINRFEEARRGVGRTLRLRQKRMIEPLAERLLQAGLTTSWEAHGGDPRVPDYWNAYCFAPDDWSIELKFGILPELPTIYVLDYRGRTYKDSSREPLDVSWADSDEVIIDAFLARVSTILQEVRAGTRSQ